MSSVVFQPEVEDPVTHLGGAVDVVQFQVVSWPVRVCGSSAPGAGDGVACDELVREVRFDQSPFVDVGPFDGHASNDFLGEDI